MARQKPPDRFHHGALDRALVDEAIALTEEQGLESWTLAEAARRLGVSSGAPYRHYKNKTELLDAVARRGLDEVRAAIEASLRREGGARAQAVAMARAVVRFARRQPVLYRLTFAGVRTDSRATLAAADDASAFGVLRSAMAGWLEAGALKAGDPVDLAIVLWAHVHGLASLIASRRIDVSEREALRMAEAHVTALFDGIAR